MSHELGALQIKNKSWAVVIGIITDFIQNHCNKGRETSV
jgi:hypothetical protein